VILTNGATTLTNMSVNSFFDLSQNWQHIGIDPICQYCCLQIPKQDNGLWDIKFPEVAWTDRTIVIMHCQDFVNVDSNGCRELELIEQHFGNRAHQVVAVTWNMDLHSVYCGPVNVVYFPYHTYEIISNLKSIKHQWLPNLQHQRTKVFQSLNGVAKKHRILAVELLKQFNNSIITLNPDIRLELFDYRSHLAVSNEENFVKLSSVYGDCNVNVVTETLYQERPGIITEKTVFAWMAMQVPIIIGYQGIVAHARELGFDMFDDIVDHSYDNYPNHTRVQAAIELNQKILSQGIDRAVIVDRLNQNLEHVLSWPERMSASYQQQIKDIYQRLTTGS
jgi:hypothetical protein